MTRYTADKMNWANRHRVGPHALELGEFMHRVIRDTQ